MNRLTWKMATRSLIKNKLLSLISILGLAVGLSAFCLILYYVHYEHHYDQFHADCDKIYRVESQFRLNGQITQDIATSSFGYAPAMHEAFPEIESFCRINLFNHEKDIKYNDVVEREEHVFMVDSNFFSFFSYPLMMGDAREVLARPFQIVFSEKAAARYFKGENQIGKTFQVKELGSTQTYTVTGVFKNLPVNSNVQFDILLSYDYGNDFLNNFWYMHEAYLYVKVPDKKTVASIEQRFPAMAEKYKVYDALKDHRWEVKLVPFASIHLNHPKPYELEQKGDSRSLYFLMGFALIMLVIAWINFINLSMVNILGNSSNYSIMQSQGANRSNLLQQYLVSAFQMNGIGLLMSVALMLIGINLLGRYFPAFNYASFWSTPLVWILLFGAFFIGLVVTGFFPGIAIPNFDGGFKIKSMGNSKAHHLTLRKGLVITQYALAIIFIISTLTINQQLNFMTTRNLGADIHQVLVFKTPTSTSNYFQKITSMRDELTHLTGVEGVALSSVVPGQQVAYMACNKRADAPQGDDRLFETLRVDADFIPLYHLKFKEGRNFNRQMETDLQNVILNEEAVKWFGFSDVTQALGKTVNIEGNGNKPFTIIGILENYHQQSLKTAFTPVVYIMGNDDYWIPMKYFSVRISTANYQQSVKLCREVFKSYFPDASFDYFFTDQYFNRQYVSDYRFGKVILALSILSIFMVCMGIFGLSGYMMTLRIKEIGVRKVSGAGVLEVLTLLNKDFVLWVLIAVAIASPIGWFIMNHWLENFAYRTNIGWWTFLVAGFAAFVVSVATVSYQTYKAATRNPVEVLKQE